MNVERDYEDLLRLFNKNRVRYCIIGSYAVAFYAKPRYTKDMDLLIDPTIENGKKIVSALNEFGFESLNLSENDFCQAGIIIQLGYEPVRIDIITSIQGCSFEMVWEHKVEGTYGHEKVFFIGLIDLIENKKQSNRQQDKDDLDLLFAARH